ncbi:MAG: DUF3788 family protein [Ignavibacteriae bacterium]|nr:DUF3788 family protein [Ignavibacteriota bacterium]MCB9207909.1 DUF3788 family protein [Ignavibacteriales bacterium]MCB9258679.1 DUF3788 family protein [Ignavibacteriales bacterium]
MEQQILHDKDQYPTDVIIFSHIGKAKNKWEKLFNLIDAEYPDFIKEWRYYNDGKSWLMKVQKKSKTIFWLSIIKNSFSITFYFPEKAEEKIFNSSIADELKEQFRNGKWYNKIRGLTITFNKLKDVEYAKTLIDIKLSIK